MNDLHEIWSKSIWFEGPNQFESNWATLWSFVCWCRGPRRIFEQLMQNIFEEFVNEGITKQEFEDKKSHLKNSLSVRMDNINNCFMLHHQTLLNGNQMTYNEILNRVKNLTLEEVNDAIEKHLVNKPIITIIAGLDK